MEQHTERLIRLVFYYVEIYKVQKISYRSLYNFYDHQQNYEERGELKAYLLKLVSQRTVNVSETLSVGDRVEVQYSQVIGNDEAQPFIDFKDIVEIRIVEEYQ